MSLVRCHAPCNAPDADPGLARFLFCLEGGLTLASGEHLVPDSFAFLPPDATVGISIDLGTQFVLFEWRFLARGQVPEKLCGTAAEIQGQPLRGDDWLKVQKLLPTDDAFDAEFNLMSFRPGALLAYVETHFMEHGLLMLDGGGVYRLDNSWYPVGAGDAIWMGPHVPQWFGALGRDSARYLIYKNYNRSPLGPR